MACLHVPEDAEHDHSAKAQQPQRDLNCLAHTCLFALVRPATAHCDSPLFMDYSLRDDGGDMLHAVSRLPIGGRWT